MGKVPINSKVGEGFRVELLLSGRSLDIYDTDTLLHALESALIPMESQCRSGYCGTCRLRLISGQVSYLTAPLAALLEGEILTCCSKPNSDLTLEY